jgi:hypothetical protein
MFVLRADHSVCIAPTTQPVTLVESTNELLGEMSGLAAYNPLFPNETDIVPDVPCPRRPLQRMRRCFTGQKQKQSLLLLLLKLS